MGAPPHAPHDDLLKRRLVTLVVLARLQEYLARLPGNLVIMTMTIKQVLHDMTKAPHDAPQDPALAPATDPSTVILAFALKKVK